MHIDLLNPESFANGHPHNQYDWLRKNDPVHWHEEPEGAGFWALTRYEDVAEALTLALILACIAPIPSLETTLPNASASPSHIKRLYM